MDKVLLGMSGGVDSSVAAVLLQKQGYEVIGATMKLCCGSNENIAIEDAKNVCDQLGIEHHVFDFSKEFKKYVIDDFVSSYESAKTPNPCVECNKYLKFNYFYNKAQELGCKYIGTGHYAKIEFSTEYNRYVLKKSDVEKKDQTYFLYNISNDILENILFPLAKFADKDEIRKIAEENNLKIHKKPDSQEICFIPDNDYSNFLAKNLKEKPKQGNIVLTTGEVFGKHTGLINYTIGQRKGLGIAYKEPLYVVDLNKEKNEVVVGTEKDLYKDELYATNLNWIAIDGITKKLTATAKIRYRAKESKCEIEVVDGNTVKVKFNEPQRAITPGQSVVFYDGDIVLGGGKIE